MSMSKPQTSPTTDFDRSSTDLLDALADERRRHALDYLSQYGVVTLDDLTSHLTNCENATGEDQRRQITISLVHNHLPRLKDAGIIAYDRTTKIVELLTAPTELTPYLALATSHDSGTGGR